MSLFRRAFVASLVLTGCGGHHDEPLSSIGIAPVTGDAVFVVNGADQTISVIDAQTDEVFGTIELVGGAFPHHAYLGPDRATLFVALPGVDLSGGHDGGHDGHTGGGGVMALDARTGETLVARRLEAANHNALHVGNAVWTTQTTAPGAVLVLDPQTLETRSTVAVGDLPSEITTSADGAFAFVANTGSDSVTILDPAGTVVETVAVGDGPVGAWPGSDGRMYVDNEIGKSISVIDPATRSVVATFALGFTPALAAIATTGELWVTDTENGKLVFLDAATGTQLGELATGAGAHALAFSADGARAYVTNQEAGTVSVIDVTSRQVTKTIAVGAKPNGIVYRAF